MNDSVCGGRKDYADIVIESLHEWGAISEQAYGRITEDKREQLADKIVTRSDE